jgi:hypothetical protein
MPDRRVPVVAVGGIEGASDLRVTAQDAVDRATASKEAFGVGRAPEVQDATPFGVRVDESEDAEEDPVLANALRTSSPVDELELCDLPIGLEIMVAPGVAGAEREALDYFVSGEDVQKRDQDPYRVDQSIDLRGQRLDRPSPSPKRIAWPSSLSHDVMSRPERC